MYTVSDSDHDMDAVTDSDYNDMYTYW
jgi:hypothetical protein